jgi:predicted membrane-bound spermidine synthase
MKKYSLEIIVFISGGVVMIFELVGSRIMAPHFGTSIFVWTNIIGVILGSLSLGYWLGGKVADRQHNQIVLSTVLLLAGLMIMLDALGQKKVFEMIQFFTTNPGWGSFIASCILFAFPSILFGIISPYAARLKMLSVTTSGTTVGSLYALSTLGSIIGTFLAGFVFIPLIGSTKILLILSIVLVVLSGICFFRKFIILKIALLLIIIAGYVVTIMQERSEEQQGIISRETAYNHVRIFDSTDVLPTHEIVKLMLNNTQIDSGMFLNKEDLVFDYTKFYRLGSYFNPHIQSALMLGGAGYSYPKDFLQRVPEAHLDVVEIDPELTELAYKYFRLPQNHPHLSIYHEDARVFLSQATSTYYDVI